MFTKLTIILCLCLWLAIASAAVNLAQIVASNEDLQEQSTNADTDVNKVTMLNGLDFAPVRPASITSTSLRHTNNIPESHSRSRRDQLSSCGRRQQFRISNAHSGQR